MSDYEVAMPLSSTTTNSLFGERKNSLIYTWDILFSDDEKEWIGFKPALGLSVFPCYACRHMFYSLSSLQDHVNRRIQVLKYNCSGCSNAILTFYNRCSFLLHTRKHYNLDQGQINLREIDVFTLPISLAGFLPHPNIPVLYGTEEELVSENVYINPQFYSADRNQKGNQIITLKPHDLIFKQNSQSLTLKQICRNIPKCEFITVEQQKILRTQNLFTEENNTRDKTNAKDIKIEPEEYQEQRITMPIIAKVESLQDKIFNLPRCLDCNSLQMSTMAEHYLGENKPKDINLSCYICKFVASTKCSLLAHIRIHENKAPHVCPDCGKSFESWLHLTDHMDEVCFHLAKHVRFRCPAKKCGKLFATIVTFSAHFKMHLKCVYTCSVCNSNIHKYSEADFHRVIHDELCNFHEIYYCPLCANLGPFNESNYKDHIISHTNDAERCMYVYLCKYCRSYFRSTTTYAKHLMQCSAKQKNVQRRKQEGSKYITKDCESCQNQIIFNAEKPFRFCNKCKQDREAIRKIAPSKRYFCMLCNKQISAADKTTHMMICRYAMPVVLVPRMTDDLINNVFVSSSSDTSSVSTTFGRKRSRSSDSPKMDESQKKKRKRIYLPNLGKIKKTDKKPLSDLTAEEPVHFDGTYYCKLCSYTNSQRSIFHNHIKSHRDISTAYQCMECGECFVVKPSLKKHLLHFHNILDHQNYLESNDCYDVQAVKELEDTMRLTPGESKEPLKENQCRVCRQQFKDSTVLNKHFRIHGMAFLLSNSK